MNYLFSSLFIVSLLMIGLSSTATAATYRFVNTANQLVSVEAGSANEALRIAPQLALHSGVWLVSGTPTTPTTPPTTQEPVSGQGLYLYQYVTTSGQLATVRAKSPQEALRTASQIAANSGVMTYRQ